MRVTRVDGVGMQGAGQGGWSGVCLIDLENMEQISIAAGDAAAAALHVAVQQRLEDLFGRGNVFGRVASYAFAIQLRDPDQAACLDRIDQALRMIPTCRLELDGLHCATTAHAGVVWQDAAPTLTALTQLAAAACATAQAHRVARVVHGAESRPGLAGTVRSAYLVSDLLSAMDENRLRLYAQEIVPLTPSADRSRQYEILIQMIDREGREHSPVAFIPLAERSSLIERLDRWVIHAALVERADSLRRRPDISLSLNVSGRSLSTPDLWPFLEQALAVSGVDPARVQIEITETSAIHDMAQARDNVRAARAAGCAVALDDFGAGLSGFMYLKSLAVSCIKIDGALVPNVVDPCSMEAEIIRSLIELADRLGVEVVAEHVSSAEILAALRQLGVDKVQGFQIGMPFRFDELLERQ